MKHVLSAAVVSADGNVITENAVYGKIVNCYQLNYCWFCIVYDWHTTKQKLQLKLNSAGPADILKRSEIH
jgi:uncharacterized protein (DUF342 family)